MAETVRDQDRRGDAGTRATRHPACPYCNAPASLLVATRDYNRATTQEDFFYFQCDACRLVFLDPCPSDLGPYYRGGYQPIPATIGELRAIAGEEKYRLDAITRYKTSGSLLEIGPWRGVFCVNAKDAGFQVTAIELDAQCVAYLNDTVGIHAIQSFDPAATLHGLRETFDVIVLWHSLEHLPRPWDVVREAAGKLNPGGLLLISIPNIESFEFSLLRGRWRHLDAPRHLFFYPPSALEALCESNGLKLLDFTTSDRVSQMLARDTWHHWTSTKSSFPLIRRVLLRLTADLARLRERRMKNAGSGMTAVFQLKDRA